MPLAYTEVPVSTCGILTECLFPLVGDGRRLYFNMGGGSARKNIYISIDGQLNETPFANGSRLDSPIRGMERVIAAPHEAYAYIIDRSEALLPSLTIPMNPVPITFDDGQRAVISLSGVLTASIRVSDPNQLIHAYLDMGIRSPESAAAAALKKAAAHAVTFRVPDTLRASSPHDAIGCLDTLALELADQVAVHAESDLPWMEITRCEVQLQIVNLQEVIDRSNTLYALNTRVKERLLEAVLQTYGANPLPPEIGQILISYVQTNPGVELDKLVQVCGELKTLCGYASPALLLQTVCQMGLLPAAGGS